MEIDLLAKYPRTRRDPASRAAAKTPVDIATARKFGHEFFDGERRHGYGGYRWSPERWAGVVDDFIAFYGPIHRLLDIGCAKGYMLRSFRERIPKLVVAGLDVSAYAISKADKKIRRFCKVGSAEKLPYKDKEFDLVVSINTIHNLPLPLCIQALREIGRVGERAYITVDAYRTQAEKKRMYDWNLTALTILHVDRWKEIFWKNGYKGEFGFWMP